MCSYSSIIPYHTIPYHAAECIILPRSARFYRTTLHPSLLFLSSVVLTVPRRCQVRVVLAWMLSVPLVAVAACLAVRYYRSNALVFRTVGANVRLQAACRRVFSTQSLLKLDAQLAVSGTEVV